MKMLSTYKKLYDHLMISKPTVASETIERHINMLVNFYQTKRSLATIEILDILYSYRSDPLLRDQLHDVYDRYEKTNFLISELNQLDIDYIKQRYIEEIIRFGRGYQCDIQT